MEAIADSMTSMEEKTKKKDCINSNVLHELDRKMICCRTKSRSQTTGLLFVVGATPPLSHKGSGITLVLDQNVEILTEKKKQPLHLGL